MEVLWSINHEDRYLTLGTDLSLYRVDNIKDGQIPKGQGIYKVSDSTYSTLLAANTENQYIKCVAWYPKPQPENLVAVGLATGKVVLTPLAKSGTTNPGGLIGKEFIPKYARQCNFIAWNPNEPSLLAAGLEKYRADSSVLIWDVQARSATELGYDSRRRAQGNLSDTAIIKPTAEIGHAEASQSLAWFPREHNTLVTGINHRSLRIYDLRDCNHPKSVAYTKAVNGVKVDPHFTYRLASYSENQMMIWDIRHFEKPVLTIQENRSILKLSWSPVRAGLIACLPKESSVVKLYDIQHTSDGSDELEPAVIERTVQSSSSGQSVTSFDWHQTQGNRLLTVTQQGSVTDSKVFERIALSWSPDIYLAWATGRQVVQCHTIKLSREAHQDISIRMKRRASKGYGVQKEIYKNGEKCEEFYLKDLWNWLYHLKQLSKPEAPVQVRAQSQVKVQLPGSLPGLQGVSAVLLQSGVTGSGGQITSSDIDFLHWQVVDGHKLKGQKKVFRSEGRYKALQLTGWGFDKDSRSLDLIDRLEKAGDFERAAAIAVFTLKMRRAIQVLNNGAELNSVDKVQQQNNGVGVNLTVVAMALSGFTDDKNTLWKEMCGELSAGLQNPYLRAMFAFLTMDADNQDAILKENELAVIDRVAYACMYLPDLKLQEYIDELTVQLTQTGNLEGIILTGLTTSGIDLLEKYVSLSGDIQTASCVVVTALPNPEIRKDPRVDNWIDSYRELLDTWRLWHERAQFDVFMNSCDSSEKPPPQVYASCNFCGKSVGNMQSVKTWNYRSYNMAFHYGGRMPQTQATMKSTMCPCCRKPLPRCALCLIHMGTPSGSGRSKLNAASDHTSASVSSEVAQLDLSEPRRKLSPIGDWFTWCQTCRHGGHAHHMSDWFTGHVECPVTGCTCKCNTLDTVDRVASTDLGSMLAKT